MMNFSLLALLVAVAVPTAAVHPVRISYESLLNGGVSLAAVSSLEQALTEVGMVSIINIPSFHKDKDDTLSGLDGCLSHSKATQEHTFGDGTRRRTLATHSVPGGIQKVQHGDHISFSTVNDCKSFDESSNEFRSTVAAVTQAFADRVSEYVQQQQQQESSSAGTTIAAEGEEDMPLLATANGFLFKTLSDVVENGEHLEHFHSYTKSMKDIPGNQEEETIEMHVDQGLFIAFTPGRMVQHPQDDPSVKTFELTSGFYIESKEGTVEEVEFNNEDDLVFMLGDGVNQYINDKLAADKKLRAVPHMLRFKSHGDKSSSRVWYGRMVLPPVDAIHPAHGTTFGQLREHMIAASHNHQEDENAGLGCSGGMVARDLSATTCEGDSMYCWHRCMNTTEHGVSEEICQGRDLQLHCINPRLQIWGEENHGDYYPACADAEVQEVETPFPTLPEYPRSEDACTDTAFDEFADTSGFDFSHDLMGGARFMWSIEDGKVRGRIAYNGLFGWLAFGFADVDGMKNGMHGGRLRILFVSHLLLKVCLITVSLKITLHCFLITTANILMALPGGNYSAYSGLDLDMPSSVEMHEIHPKMTPFRYWMTPAVSTKSDEDIGAFGIEDNDCFTAMSFKQSSIGKYTFNLTGSDELIWAANGQDYFVQYHGPEARGRFAIHWPTGEVKMADHEHEDGDDHEHEDGADLSAAFQFHYIISFSALLFALLV